MSVNFTLQPLPKDGDTNRPDLFAAALFFMLAAVGKLAAADLTWLIRLLLRSEDPLVEYALNSVVYYLGFILLPVLLYMKKYPVSVDRMRINPISGRSAALCTLAAVVNLFLMTIVTSLWYILVECMGGVIYEPVIPMPSTTGGLILMIVFVAILPGIAEELLFRGALLNAWEERGSKNAIVITSVWFMLLHSSIIGMPNQLITGIILAVIVVSTDSILAGVIFHTVHNSVSLIISYVTEQAASAMPAAAPASVSMLEVIGGIPGLISFMLPAAGLTAVLIVILKALDKERLNKKRFTFGYPPAYGRDPSLAEYLILSSGFAVSLILFLPDLLRIAGWL